MTVAERPLEQGPTESPTLPWESDTTHRWVATMVEKETRRPASDPSPPHKTTRKLPFTHSGIVPAHLPPPRP